MLRDIKLFFFYFSCYFLNHFTTSQLSWWYSMVWFRSLFFPMILYPIEFNLIQIDIPLDVDFLKKIKLNFEWWLNKIRIPNTKREQELGVVRFDSKCRLNEYIYFHESLVILFFLERESPCAILCCLMNFSCFRIMTFDNFTCFERFLSAQLMAICENFLKNFSQRHQVYAPQFFFLCLCFVLILQCRFWYWDSFRSMQFFRSSLDVDSAQLMSLYANLL